MSKRDLSRKDRDAIARELWQHRRTTRMAKADPVL
jgi:hypothetical protein